MLKMCEEEGLVHTVMNTKALGHVICNCCDDCCINWPGPLTSEINFAAPSRFTSVVDKDICSGCEACLERCYFEAITMEEDIAVISKTKCMGCGLCSVTCPDEAITFREVRDEAFIPN
jgi:Pyruvate/2-oxoacid:ferredoxin oxidoreductase delta subunit